MGGVHILGHEQARLLGVLHVNILVAELRLQACEAPILLAGLSLVRKHCSAAKILVRNTPNKRAYLWAVHILVLKCTFRSVPPYKILLKDVRDAVFIVLHSCHSAHVVAVS